MPEERKTAENVFASGMEYNYLMSSLDVSVSRHLLDEHYTVIWANDRYYQMFGYTKEEYETLFHNQCDLFYQDDKDEWENLVENITEAFSGNKKYDGVCRMRHKNGRKLWIKLVGNLTDETLDGYPVCYTVMMDITEQMQLKVEQSVTYNNFPGLIAKFRVMEEGFDLIYANKKYFEVFPKKEHYPLESLTEQSGLGNVALFYDSLQAGESVSFLVSPCNKAGRRTYMDVTAVCIDWEGIRPVYLLIYADVTRLNEQKILLEQKNRELEYIAYTDQVTGGMNRNLFEIKAGKAIHTAAAYTYALVWLNLQKFKLINEMAGNEQGNKTLKFIYDTLVSCLNEGEYVARTAADNYTLLIKNADDQTISNRLAHMAKAANSFNDKQKYRYVLSFTAGVYRIDNPGMELTNIQDKAHTARKESSKTDSGLCACRFYSEQEHEKLIFEKEMENKMWPALENHEFIVYLQPKVSLRNGAVAGAEALVRWIDPQRGMIQPGAFIPFFEKNGFVANLDLYVFEEVCRMLRGWLDRGMTPVPISVNMSRVHFSAPDFVESYKDICKKYDVPPSLLEIEVTENIIFEDPKVFAEIVAKIHAAGFSCSMDDFGSGYSSLNMLKDIDVDVLKLDKVFFSHEQMDSARGRDVVSTVIDLAKKLEMSTVAEGVETEIQEKFLEETDCDMVQGFVFFRPMPEKDFEKLVFQRGDGNPA